MGHARPRLAMILLLVLFSRGVAEAGEADPAYRSRFMVAGYFLRAGKVCDSDGKHLISAALNFLSLNEIKSVSEAFPALTERWLTEGADGFNSKVMTIGIGSTCGSAVADLQRIEGADRRMPLSDSAKAGVGRKPSAADQAGRGQNNKVTAPAQAGGLERWTNPADVEFCSRPSVVNLIANISGVVSAHEVRAGQLTCDGLGSPGSCRRHVSKTSHACHALVVARSAPGETPGTFFIDEASPLSASFMSDALQRANEE
jgi:hypothetical protein